MMASGRSCAITNINTTSGLLKLPIELMDEVTDCLQAEDFALLRASCRELNNKLIRKFAIENFSHKSFSVYWPKSLETFEEISKHEVFAPALRKVTLCFLKVESTMIGDRRRKGGGKRKIGDCLLTGSARVELSQAHDRVLASMNACWTEWKSERLYQVLWRALTNLRAVQTTGIGLDICNYIRSNMNRPCGEKALARTLQYSRCLVADPRPDNDHVKQIIGLVFASGCLIADLSVAELHTPVKLQALPVILGSRAISGFGRPFESSRLKAQLKPLTSINLLLDAEKEDWISIVERIIAIINLAPNLTKLKLCSRLSSLSDGPDVWKRIAEKARMPSLKEAAFRMPWFSSQSVDEFVEHHSKTLRSLVLDRRYVSIGERSALVNKSVPMVDDGILEFRMAYL